MTRICPPLKMLIYARNICQQNKKQPMSLLLPMASTQFNEPASQSCQQKCHSGTSLDQKISEMASWVTGKHHGQHTNNQSHCPSQTLSKPHYPTQTEPQKTCHGVGQGQGKSKKKERGMFHKIKDGNSSSSSDSESDNEGCHKRKASFS